MGLPGHRDLGRSDHLRSQHNRVNIIFYPIILLCAYGIGLTVRKWKKLWPVVAAAYGISSILFFGTYFTTYAEESREYYNKDFMEAVAEADSL